MRVLRKITCVLICAASFGFAQAGPHVQPIPVPRPDVQAIEAPAEQDVAEQVENTIPLPRARPGTPLAEPVKTATPVATIAQGDEELLKQLSVAYSKVQSMRANFVQLSGTQRTTGTLNLMKPGKFNFAYAPPNMLEVVCDGTTVVVRDNKLKTTSTYGLDQTPLRVLMMKTIDLSRDVRVTSIIRRDEVIEVRIDESKSALQGEITLYFSKKDFSLQQWNIMDAQGVETNIALSNIENNISLDSRLFRIDLQAVRQ